VNAFDQCLLDVAGAAGAGDEHQRAAVGEHVGAIARLYRRERLTKPTDDV
jgi:hypothetical protein